MAFNISISNIEKISPMKIMMSLFFLFVVILYINPGLIKKLNSSVLGRLVIVIIIIYFSTKNPVAGLLAALVIISIMQNSIYQEGVEVMGAEGDAPAGPTTGPTDGKGSSKHNIKRECKKNEGRIKIAGCKNYPTVGCIGNFKMCVPKKSVIAATANSALSLPQAPDVATTTTAPNAPTAVESFTTGKFSYGDPELVPAPTDAHTEPVVNETVGDLLSNDPTRKKKQSKHLTQISAKSGSTEDVRPSETSNTSKDWNKLSWAEYKN